ncbi:MAG: anthranilate phosphoribosyltransferase, partial [Lachnospiraceae bacterium]|nr:anthranilate phosphoribosyltransferase [Lachnospiraceae bacterium]
GAKIDADTAVSEKMLAEENMCFLFAQKYHPAMRFVGGVRKEIGIRTLFNILGPLANPAGISQILLGVFDESLVEPLAHVVSNLGVKRGMVVYGMDRMDEISMSAPTKVCEVREGNFTTYEITPEQYGFRSCAKEDLVGGKPSENAQIVRDVLSGKEGPMLDAVLFNAGAAIHIADGSLTIEEGIAAARKVIETGAATAQLEKMIAGTNR